MKEKAKVGITGHVLIRYADNHEVIRDVYNDVHKENLSEAIALSLGDYSRGFIEEMHFGNGGSLISSTGEITYFPPLVTDANADLYNPTYFKVVNDRSSSFTSDATTTNIKTVHVTGTTYTDVIITCTLDYGEPSDQDSFDQAATTSGKYIFDELGLKSVDSDTGIKKLLTHVIFDPVQKALNRSIEIIYTLRISLS